jgi:hypothetical protein
MKIIFDHIRKVVCRVPDDNDQGLSRYQMEAWNQMVDIQAERACKAEARVKELEAELAQFDGQAPTT